MNDVRSEYRLLTAQDQQRIKSVKDAGQVLIDVIRGLDTTSSREIALALTKAEESVMWAVKHVTK